MFRLDIIKKKRLYELARECLPYSLDEEWHTFLNIEFSEVQILNSQIGLILDSYIGHEEPYYNVEIQLGTENFPGRFGVFKVIFDLELNFIDDMFIYG